MNYEEAIIDGALHWRDSPRDGKDNIPWIPRTRQELTTMLMEARNAAARMYPMIVIDQPTISSPQQPIETTYPNPPWTVTY